MSGDGVSLQTSLVQLGNVAKTTAKAAQPGHGATPAHEPAERREEARLKRVNDAEKTERQHVDPDRRREKNEQQARQNHADDGAPPDPDGQPQVHPEESSDGEHSGLGGLFDRKA